MLAKDLSYLHENVILISPLAEIHEKEAVIAAAKNLAEILQNIIFGSRFAMNHQIMFAYDFIFPSPIENLRAAVLIDFTNSLISRIELFYDAKPFVEKRIFDNNE